MKRKILIFISVFTIILLTGCSKNYINLREKEFVFNVGEDIPSEASNYVRASKDVLEEMVIDISNVDCGKVGTYNASVSYRDRTQDFKIKITDLKAPDIVLKKRDFYFEKGGSIKLDDVVNKVSDISDFTYGFADQITAPDSKKNMLETLTFEEIGNYTCEVIAKDAFGNISVEDFIIHITDKGEISQISQQNFYGQFMNSNKGVSITDINSISNEGIYFGVGNSADSDNRPNLAYYEIQYNKYRVDFIQPKSRYVWLTFNEILEYNNTGTILDILKEKDVSAVFFVTLEYAKKNPKLIKRMIDEGHVIGNYTANCVNVPELSVNSLTTELNLLYNYLYETYGYETYLFRTPSGYFSEQALALAQSLGYRTVFWSFAYADWDANNQPDVAASLENALNKVHPGEIFLLSGSSTTNKDMLSDLIDGVREKNLEFAIYQKN